MKVGGTTVTCPGLLVGCENNYIFCHAAPAETGSGVDFQWVKFGIKLLQARPRPATSAFQNILINSKRNFTSLYMKWAVMCSFYIIRRVFGCCHSMK